MTVHEKAMNVVMVILFTAAIVELIYSVRRKKGIHSFRDTVSSIVLGIGQQTINLYLSATFLAVYIGIHASFRLATWDTHVWWHWVLFVPLCDLSYYTGHRLAHNVNFFVAAHVVHHHAEDFNLLSAMRQSWTAWMVMFPFFLPLALLGVPLEMFVFGQLGIMFFQFSSHLGVFRGNLGVLNRIFITPQNHRVHHGGTAPYWGSNCGGMFVIWDRVFGSYVEEDPDIPLKIGGGLRLNFYDPFVANIDYYRRLFFVSRRREGLWAKISIWFQNPQVLEQELRRLGYQAQVPEADVQRGPMGGQEKAIVAGSLLLLICAFAVHRKLFEHSTWAISLATGLVVMLMIGTAGRLLSRAQVQVQS